jgi:hypothetical protein
MLCTAQIKEVTVDKKRGTHGGVDKCIQDFG